MRTGRISLYFSGSLISNVGDGMLTSALPLLVLQIRGSTSAGFAIAGAQAAPYLLATVVAFTVGLTKIRVRPRTLLSADCVIRGIVFTGLGVLALRGMLGLGFLLSALLLGSAFRMLAISNRRIVATSVVDERGRLAANGLLGLSSNLALYAIGPVIGGVVSVVSSPGVALLADGCTFFALLAAIHWAIPLSAGVVKGKAVSVSGLKTMLRIPLATRLFFVVFCFNLFYMPIEVALPLLVKGPLAGNGTALGLIWSGFGIGALIGSFCVNWLRRFEQQRLMVAIIAAWAAVALLLALSPSVPIAIIAFSIGGLVYAPFTPVVYTFVQSHLSAEDQQPVITLWSAGAAVASPIGLALAGPLVTLLGAAAASSARRC